MSPKPFAIAALCLLFAITSVGAMPVEASAEPGIPSSVQERDPAGGVSAPSFDRARGAVARSPALPAVDESSPGMSPGAPDPPGPNPRHLWTEFAPPRREGHSLVYDSKRDRFILVGGEMWELRLRPRVTWTHFDTKGARPNSSAAVYDALNDRLLVLGGGKLWELPLGKSGTWSVLIDGGLPVGAVAIDPVSGDVFAAVGSTTPGGVVQVWRIDPSMQSPPEQIRAGGTPPSGWLLATLAFDPAHRRLYMYGHFTGVFALDLGTTPAWVSVPQRPDYSGYRGERLVFDDRTGNVLRITQNGNIDSYSYGSTAWTPLSTAQLEQYGIIGFAVVLDPLSHSLVLHGGVGSNIGVTSRDLNVLDLDHDGTWQIEGPRGGPSGGGSAAIDPVRDRMIHIGGFHFTAGTELPIVIQPLDDDDAEMRTVMPAPGPQPGPGGVSLL